MALDFWAGVFATLLFGGLGYYLWTRYKTKPPRKVIGSKMPKDYVSPDERKS